MFEKQKVYYFCEKTLTYKEKSRFSWKTFFKPVMVVVLVLLTIIIIDFFNNNSIVNFVNNYIKSEKKNTTLSKTISDLKYRIDTLQIQINRLLLNSRDLSLIVNLPGFNYDALQLGVGGKVAPENAGFYEDTEFSDLNEIELMINKISRQIKLQKNRYNEIFSKYKEDKKLFECIPAIKPMIGTYDKNGFGIRLHPILNYYKMHYGVDIIGSEGTKVYVAGYGVVERVGYEGGYGLSIEINHGYGYKTLYAHLSGSDVSVGDKVVRGQKIASCGNSGLSAGPHLHYEVKINDSNVDPVKFFIDEENSIVQAEDRKN